MDNKRWMAGAILAFACACGGPPGMTGDPDSGPRMDTGIPVDAFVPPTDGFVPMVDSGPIGCVADGECDDGVDCTTDSCVTSSGNCRHVVTPALCDPGESCDPVTGCEMGSACATSTDCEDDDPCTTMELCDPASRVCTFVPLDGDSDGDPPRVCGGGDCDDSRPGINSGAAESCDSMDNNCDGRVDEGFDLMTDDDNCGRCGMSCSTGLSCSAGMCQCDDASLMRCGSASAPYCVDTDTAPTDCGMCGRVCPDGCVGGSCTCPGSQTYCGSACVDTSTNPFNCGMCGRACPIGQTCSGGTCGCPAGQTACGTSCVMTGTDANNCGRCGRRCGSTGTCSAGVCTWFPGRCVDGFMTCGGENVCVRSDPLNCGTCGTVCPGDCDGGSCR